MLELMFEFPVLWDLNWNQRSAKNGIGGARKEALGIPQHVE